MLKPVTLLVLDGFGIAPPSKGNAITQAKMPVYQSLLTRYPHGQLIASGESVGLPANEEGNSEVGHLTIGVGRVVLQSLMRIRASIEDKTFFENKALLDAAQHVKSHRSDLHLIGLVSSGEVHASIDHFYALLQFCVQESIPRTFLHLITDGRDAPPTEAQTIIATITEKIKSTSAIQIATISGRYYAMDRDARWSRTQKAYQAMVLGQGRFVNSPLEAIQSAYAANQTDEFIEPTVIVQNNQPVGTIKNNDAAIFFNFRIDRPRQLTMAFTMKDFETLEQFEVEHDPHSQESRPVTERRVLKGPTFQREFWPQNLFFVTMTEYQANIPVSSIAFPPLSVPDSLASTLARNNLRQLHLAESEKERMVTYYFDGIVSACQMGEEVIIIPSPKVSTYDKKPEMSIHQIASKYVEELNKSTYHFFVINFANPDMVAHTGNIAATIKALEETDKALEKVFSATYKAGGTLLLTADHGNAEELLSFPTGSFFYTTAEGSIDTSHSNNPVPVIIAGPAFEGKAAQLPQGSLADIAPTVLSIMGLPAPPTMTGKNLLNQIT